MSYGCRLTVFWVVGLGALFSACGTGDPPLGYYDSGLPPECITDRDCDDGNMCTLDRCNRRGECENIDNNECDCRRASDCDGLVRPRDCHVVVCEDRTCKIEPDPSTNGDRCDDGNRCTRSDFCSNGMCVGSDEVRCPTAGPCEEEGTCSPTTGSCTNRSRPNGTSCNADSDGCTQGDECQGGICRAGTRVTCDDRNDCTRDECRSTGNTSHTCEVEVVAGECLIGDRCYEEGDANPSQPCQACDPDDSQTRWSANAGASCGSSCSGTCSASGSCGGFSADSFEPNNSNPGRMLGSISDGDDYPVGRFTANLSSSDEDWYWYEVSDDFFGIVNPKVELRDMPGIDYDLCAYYECESSDSDYDVDCDAGSSSTLGSLEGCCSRLGGSSAEMVWLDPVCNTSGEEDGTVIVRVFRSGSGGQCSYSLVWGDD